MENILEIKNLSVSYNEKKVLKNIDLYIKKNKITSIIGPSGCGKSTFLKSLNLLLFEEKEAHIEGNIFFNKKNIKDMDMETVRKNIGLVFQTPAPFPFSIYKNMTYVPEYYGIKNRAELDRIVKEKLSAAGLYEEVKDNLKMSALKLSGGTTTKIVYSKRTYC